MDPKKQNLTPELKQVYDRVMNTQVSKTAPTALSTPATPPAATTTPAPATPLPTTPAAPNVPAAPDTFLSSVPPRPLTDDKTFVFTGKKVTTPEHSKDEHKQAQPAVAGGKKISGKIIVLLVVVLVIVWGVFWAKLFGLI